jgi:hypothetical protein
MSLITREKTSFAKRAFASEGLEAVADSRPIFWMISAQRLRTSSTSSTTRILPAGRSGFSQGTGSVSFMGAPELFGKWQKKISKQPYTVASMRKDFNWNSEGMRLLNSLSPDVF